MAALYSECGHFFLKKFLAFCKIALDITLILAYNKNVNRSGTQTANLLRRKRKMEKIDIISRMDQLHSGTARGLVYSLGGNPQEIIDRWTARIGEKNPLADLFGGDPTLTLDDAAEGAYWDIVRYAKKLYFSGMTRDTAAIVANAITYNGTLKLATDVEFSDLSFADAWSAAHPDQPRLSRPVDIG